MENNDLHVQRAVRAPAARLFLPGCPASFAG